MQGIYGWSKRAKQAAARRAAGLPRRARRELAVLIGLALAILLSNFAGFASACADVRADTLRLHILANSDSDADQTLKLAVRDAILAQAGALFGGGATKAQALDAAEKSLPALRQIALETLRAHGCADDVTVRLENLYFDTREYDGFTLPAGRYDAVRVEIGAHAGKNWFCVLFPPLCVPAASGQDADGPDAGGPDASAPSYTDAERDVLHSPYRIRFAAVELLEEWKESLAGQEPDPPASTPASTPDPSPADAAKAPVKKEP